MGTRDNDNLEKKNQPIRETDLPYQLRAYYRYKGGVERLLVPGRFLEPEDLYYGLDYFLDIETYDLLVSIVDTLQLSTHDRLVIMGIVMQNDPQIVSNNGGKINQQDLLLLEIVNMKTGEVVDSVDYEDV